MSHNALVSILDGRKKVYLDPIESFLGCFTKPPSSSKTRFKNKQIDHTHFLVSEVSNLYLSDRFSDVVLIVEEERLPAHRIVLALRSEYFRVLYYGGLKETYELNVNLSEAPLIFFKILLEYIYTGRLNLSVLEDIIEIFELLRISDFFAVSNLKLKLHKYLQKRIKPYNAFSFLAMTRFYRFEELEVRSLDFIESNVLDVLDSQDFLSLSSEALREILNRDSFYANELAIFHAVCNWIDWNKDQLDADTKIKVWSAVRYPLMSARERSKAKKSTVVSSDIIKDAIRFRRKSWPPHRPQFRGQLKPDQDLDYREFPVNFYTDNGTNMIRLVYPSTINYIELTLWYETGDAVDELRCFSYYVEVSMDRHDWTLVVDHSNYNCRSYQCLWIRPQIAQFIRFVGTNSAANATFKVYDVGYNTKYMHKFEIGNNGLVVPKGNYNVASVQKYAVVIKGENSVENKMLLNKYRRDKHDRYTYHLLGSGSIVVHLAQPYILSSMRLLLWGGEDQAYSYTVEVSIDHLIWKTIVDKSKKMTRSWQVLRFKSMPVLYIRITGVDSSTGNDFRCVYLEAPFQVTLHSNVVEDHAENNVTDVTMSEMSALTPVV